MKIVLTITANEALDIRMAVNKAAMEWGDQASEHRKAGRLEDAATCERIRRDHHDLWEKVNAAQERAMMGAEAIADAMFAAEMGE